MVILNIQTKTFLKLVDRFVCFLCYRFEYLFNFDNTFEIHDDIEVLKRMGMAFGLEKKTCSEDDLKLARSMVPKALEPYVVGKSDIRNTTTSYTLLLHEE